MSDCALFIIIVPNDIANETTQTLLTAVDNGRNNEGKPQLVTDIPARTALVIPGSLTVPSVTVSPVPLEEMTSEELYIANMSGPSSQLPRPSTSREHSLCRCLKIYLEQKVDIDAVWMISDDKKTYQITFYVEFGLVCDEILQELRKFRIGVKQGTKILIVPSTCIIGTEPDVQLLNQQDDKHHAITNDGSKFSILNREIGTTGSQESGLTLKRRIKNKINESDFKKSVRARLMVHQVVAAIRASTELTFDFVVLLVLASMLAAFGLLENSTVIIVASMLVSPLMNPILGIAFGLSVREHSLWKRGLWNEIIGLIICLASGFVLGLFTTFAETKWGSSSTFPTTEMRSRGDVKRLWVGVLIALPSGAGVALSVLGGNTGSLVGVAISASLLPPAVNCGLLFAYALLGASFPSVAAIHSGTRNDDDPNQQQFHFKNLSQPQSIMANCEKYVNNNYNPLYSCNLATEAGILGACSFLLTIVNILCIITMALIILRIKEVVPLPQINDDIAQFFHHDVKIARDYNKTILQEERRDSTNQLAQTIANKWKTLRSLSSAGLQQIQEQNEMAKSKNDHTLNGDDGFTKVNDTENNIDYFQRQMNNSARRKLYRLQSFAKGYGLDVFNRNDYELASPNSREKVQTMARDLVQFSAETQQVDLSRYIPYGVTNEQLSPYRDMNELLPPKWNEIFVYEQQLKKCTTQPQRSYSFKEPKFHLKKNESSNHSFPENKQSTPVVQRVSSLQEIAAAIVINTDSFVYPKITTKIPVKPFQLTKPIDFQFPATNEQESTTVL